MTSEKITTKIKNLIKLKNIVDEGILVGEMWIDSIKIFYRNLCLITYGICFDPIGTHKKIRIIIRFLFGFSIAFLFYVTMIIGLDLDPYMSTALGGIIGIMLSTGCALSVQVRCVCLLTIPAFLGRAGRSLLRALVLGYLIAGPIFNLTYNGKEVVRTFACTTKLMKNLTETRYNLMFQPLQQAMFNVKRYSNDMEDTFASVKDLISPIVEEMEGQDGIETFNEDNDYIQNIPSMKNTDVLMQKLKKSRNRSEILSEFHEKKYRERIEARCEEQLSSGSDRCREENFRNMFHEMYDKCYISVTWLAAWILCWPMKLTFICNIVQLLGGSRICDSRDKVDSGIGSGYISLKDARDKLSGDMKDAWIQYRIDVKPTVLGVHRAVDTARAVMHEFNVRRDFFDISMTFLKRCLTLVFLKIIHNAQIYHEKFLTDIEYDNIYVTPYFHKIDARRKARSSSSILPLRKNEKAILIDSCTLMPNLLERRYLIDQIIKLILEVATATTIIILDQIFFETLDIIRRHGYVEYIQTGHHDVNLNVHGTGIIASLIMSTIRGFNLKKCVKMVISNGECLPLPNKLNYYILMKIYGTYLAVMVMLFLSSFTQRLQHRICEFFYVKRKKRRILYLYNETLRKRCNYNKFMREEVKNLVRQRHLEVHMKPWTASSIHHPYWIKWLEFFAFFRRKCLICKETEPRKKSNFHTCTMPECGFIYCFECWQDIGKICLACIDSSQSENKLNYFYQDQDVKSIHKL